MKTTTPTGPVELHCIQLHADGHIVNGLEILDIHEGDREKGTNTLLTGRGIEFLTRARKRFFLRYGEFSFIINPAPSTLARA